jgi:hypothetical protein
MGKAHARTAKQPGQFETGDNLTPQRAAQLRGRVDIPDIGRVEKSNGFEVSVLVQGDIPTVRTREKFILTPPDDRRAMIAEAIADLRARGKLSLDGVEIHIKETAADRLLNPAEHEAICWYIRVHAKVTAGHVSIGNYGQKVRRPEGSEDDHDRPLNDAEKVMHSELQKVLPEPHLAFLDWLSAHEYPGSRDGVAPSKIDIGKQIIDSRDGRRAEGGAEGFLRAVAQNISHWEGEIETVQRRKLMAVKELAAHRKKIYR